MNGTGEALPSLEATHAIAASTIRGGRDLHVSAPGNRREVMCGTRTPSLNAHSAKPCLHLRHPFFLFLFCNPVSSCLLFSPFVVFRSLYRFLSFLIKVLSKNTRNDKGGEQETRRQVTHNGHARHRCLCFCLCLCVCLCIL